MEYVERKRVLFFGLPWTFTKYTLNDDIVTIKKGFLSITEDDAYMYKVQDVRLTKSFWERIFGLSTVVLYTGDITHPEIKLVHIKRGSEIKNFLLDASEEARRKRRTLHSMNIGMDDDASDMIDLD